MIVRPSQNDEPVDAFLFFVQTVRDGCMPNTSCFASVLG